MLESRRRFFYPVAESLEEHKQVRTMFRQAEMAAGRAKFQEKLTLLMEDVGYHDHLSSH